MLRAMLFHLSLRAIFLVKYCYFHLTDEELEFRDNELLAESLNRQVMEKDSGPSEGLAVPFPLYL